MFQSIYNKVKKIFSKSDIGISFNDKIKLKDLPEKIPNDKSIFYKLNNDLNIFEVTKVIRNPDLVCIIEIGTDNEYAVDLKLFNYLFTNVPIPKEVQF